MKHARARAPRLNLTRTDARFGRTATVLSLLTLLAAATIGYGAGSAAYAAWAAILGYALSTFHRHT